MTAGFRSLVMSSGMALLYLGCESPASPTAAGAGLVSLRIAAAGTGQGSAVGVPDTVRLGGDLLVLTSVELVLRRIELEAEDDACEDGHGRRGDDCADFQIGPLLVALAPGRTAHVIRAQVSAGTYKEIEFEIHKPDDDTPEDRAFLRAHPDLRRVSIRVRGTFNGRPFTWVTDLNEEQEIAFLTPLVVEAGVETELVLRVDVRAWFQVGGRLVDPVTALKGQVHENLVRANVRGSFRAFERED